LPQVGNDGKLGRFCGKYGMRRVEYGKYGICKLRNSLLLRFFGPIKGDAADAARFAEE
jgi:hypothetical protein